MRLHFKIYATVLLMTSLVGSGVFAAADAAQAPAPDAIIYPKATAEHTVLPDARPGSGSLTIVVILAVAAAGMWIWQRRRAQGGFVVRNGQKLSISETKSLGNRQFLVVANYEDKTFLLSVCPGSIQLLTPLQKGSEMKP